MEQEPQPVNGEDNNDSKPPVQPERPAQQLSYKPPQPPKKSSMKKILLILTVVLLVIAGALAYVLLQNNDVDETAQSNIESDQYIEPYDENPTIYYVQTGPLVEFIDATGELVAEANLESNDTVTEIRRINGETRVYYYSTTPDDFWSEVITSYGYVSDGQKNELVEVEGGNAIYAEPVISPDATKAVSELGYTGDGRMGDVYLHDLEDGTSELIYDTITNQQQGNDLFVMIGWLDNSTVLLQDQSCRECDGPTKPILRKLNVDNGTITDAFNTDDSIRSLSWAEVFMSQGDVYLFGGDYAKVFGGELNSDYAPDELYAVDMQSGESRLITTFDNDLVLTGNIDNDDMYVTVRDALPVENEEGLDGQLSLTYADSKLLKVNLSNGTKTEVNLETKYFSDNSYVSFAFSNEYGYLLLTNTSFSPENNDSEAQDSGVLFSLFSLPVDNSENEIDVIKEQRSVIGEEKFISMSLFEVE